MEIEIQETEIAVLKILGNLRTLQNRSNNINDTQRDKRNKSDVELDGLIGEYAFCKINNIFMDIDVCVRSGSYDCMYKGYRLDIKTTRHTNGRLIAYPKKNPDVDIYVLCIIDGNKVSFPGYAKTEELFKEENIVNLGYGDTYAINQENLRTFKK